MQYTIEPFPPGTAPRLLIDGQQVPCSHCAVALDALPASLGAPWPGPRDPRYTITYTDPAGEHHSLRARWVAISYEAPCLTLDVTTTWEGS